MKILVFSQPGSLEAGVSRSPRIKYLNIVINDCTFLPNAIPRAEASLQPSAKRVSKWRSKSILSITNVSGDEQGAIFLKWIEAAEVGVDLFEGHIHA